MINMFPDSPLMPRAKQKLRDVQEVLAERETHDRHLLREPGELSRLLSPAFRRWLIHTRSTQRAIRHCWLSAMHTPAKRTRC